MLLNMSTNDGYICNSIMIRTILFSIPLLVVPNIFDFFDR